MTSRTISGAVAAGLLICGTALPAGAQVPRQLLTPPPNHWLQFGYALDASAATLVVSAPDSIRNNDASNCAINSASTGSGYGAVAVYSKSGSDWVLSQQLWHDQIAPNDFTDYEPRFGDSISLRGNTLVVGAPRVPVSGLLQAGGFYVFQRTSPSTTFSRVGPIGAPAPSEGERLGDNSGVATNGTYVAVAEDASRSVLYYRIQGNTVSYVASTPSLAGIPDRLFITDNNVLIAFISGYPTLLAYQLGPSGLSQIDTSSLMGGSLRYTRAAGGGGNTFVSGLNSDPTAYRAVTFGAGAVSSVKTLTVPIPYFVTTTPSAGGAAYAKIAVKEGSGVYVSPTPATIGDGYIAGILGGNFTSVNTSRPSTMAGVVSSGSWGQPITFSGFELFVSDPYTSPGGQRYVLNELCLRGSGQTIPGRRPGRRDRVDHKSIYAPELN
jgi:hypothetical protein